MSATRVDPQMHHPYRRYHRTSSTKHRITLKYNIEQSFINDGEYKRHHRYLGYNSYDNKKGCRSHKDMTEATELSFVRTRLQMPPFNDANTSIICEYYLSGAIEATDLSLWCPDDFV